MSPGPVNKTQNYTTDTVGGLVEHLAAEESDNSLRSHWRKQTELKERED